MTYETTDGPRNPFLILADLLRTLRKEFLEESGFRTDASLMSPRAGELLGSIASLIDDCETLRKQVDNLGKFEPDVWRAFRRAQEKV